jgi:hypothetical protein
VFQQSITSGERSALGLKNRQLRPSLLQQLSCCWLISESFVYTDSTHSNELEKRAYSCSARQNFPPLTEPQRSLLCSKEQLPFPHINPEQSTNSHITYILSEWYYHLQLVLPSSLSLRVYRLIVSMHFTPTSLPLLNHLNHFW